MAISCAGFGLCFTTHCLRGGKVKDDQWKDICNLKCQRNYKKVKIDFECAILTELSNVRDIHTGLSLAFWYFKICSFRSASLAASIDRLDSIPIRLRLFKPELLNGLCPVRTAAVYLLKPNSLYKSQSKTHQSIPPPLLSSSLSHFWSPFRTSPPFASEGFT